jgi:hypothetical protein
VNASVSAAPGTHAVVFRNGRATPGDFAAQVGALGGSGDACSNGFARKRLKNLVGNPHVIRYYMHGFPPDSSVQRNRSCTSPYGGELSPFSSPHLALCSHAEISRQNPAGTKARCSRTSWAAASS